MVKADNVDKVVSQVAHIADVAARLTPTDINKIADVLDHSTQVGKLSEKVRCSCVGYSHVTCTPTIKMQVLCFADVIDHSTHVGKLTKKVRC